MEHHLMILEFNNMKKAFLLISILVLTLPSLAKNGNETSSEITRTSRDLVIELEIPVSIITVVKELYPEIKTDKEIESKTKQFILNHFRIYFNNKRLYSTLEFTDATQPQSIKATISTDIYGFKNDEFLRFQNTLLLDHVNNQKNYHHLRGDPKQFITNNDNDSFELEIIKIPYRPEDQQNSWLIIVIFGLLMLILFIAYRLDVFKN